MIVYHGTTLEVPKPRILHSDIGRDFGFAFYATDIKDQAERWATRRAKLEERRTGKHAKAIVNIYIYIYEWLEDPRMSILKLEGVSLEWLDMVVNCRSNINFSHGYDIVYGKIADDNVGETVSFVIQGIMRKEDALARLRFEKINYQIAFCSERSLESLRYKGFYEIT